MYQGKTKRHWVVWWTIMKSWTIYKSSLQFSLPAPFSLLWDPCVFFVRFWAYTQHFFCQRWLGHLHQLETHKVNFTFQFARARFSSKQLASSSSSFLLLLDRVGIGNQFIPLSLLGGWGWGFECGVNNHTPWRHVILRIIASEIALRASPAVELPARLSTTSEDTKTDSSQESWNTCKSLSLVLVMLSGNSALKSSCTGPTLRCTVCVRAPSTRYDVQCVCVISHF
jgi:hypothetical protein